MTTSIPPECDVLVIGSGLAGLWFALQAAPHSRVLLITKGAANDTATRKAQGGVAAVVAPADSPEQHAADTMAAGAGLCDPQVVRMVVEEGPARVAELEGLGVRFDRHPNGAHDLGLEGGHHQRRVLHAGDVTGNAIQQTMLDVVRRLPSVQVCEHVVAVDLLTVRPAGEAAADENHCVGARVLDTRSGAIVDVRAAATVLATGGIGRAWSITSNPAVATGDGIALAWRAGCTLRNMEFVQFHPTCLHRPGAETFLLSEAMRGEGGVLRNAAGDAFMERHHPLGSLAPRDVVARAIELERRATGQPVVLDMTDVDWEFLVRRFPTLHCACLQQHIDMRVDPIPVQPGCHYSCGGVRTGLHGQTDMPGLYAIGETACTGLHGANRLASNSLLEALVFAHRAAGHVEDSRVSPPMVPTAAIAPCPEDRVPTSLVDWVHDVVPPLMQHLVGVIRTQPHLRLAASHVRQIAEAADASGPSGPPTRNQLEARNLLAVAQMVVQSAQQRSESRGTHWLSDLPFTREDPAVPTDIRIECATPPAAAPVGLTPMIDEEHLQWN
ncbi:MAG: L-aspartate oxidase [Planctomycetota bacterium]